MLMAPLLNAAAGFIGGVLLAGLYNLAAQITGGLEILVADEPAAKSQAD